jgi:hypothetical protein
MGVSARLIQFMGVVCVAAGCKVGLAEHGDSGIEPAPDAGPACVWFRDADQDGYGDPTMMLERCDQPGGYVDNDDDCDDADPDANISQVWYADADGDGFGDPAEPKTQCGPPAGHVLDGTDCDDMDAEERPDQTWHLDFDADGFGHPSVTMPGCARPPMHVSDGRDCDDMNGAVHPGTGACPFTPADGRSCLDILDDGRSEGTGAYLIDPDGGGSATPMVVWCDMELDGGGWTALLNPSTAGMPQSAIAGFSMTWSHLSGDTTCTGAPNETSANNSWGRYASDCGHSHNVYTIDWPNALGATDIAFVAVTAAANTNALAVDGVDIAPDALETAASSIMDDPDFCHFYNAAGAGLPAGADAHACVTTWHDVAPAVHNDAFSGALDLTIDLGDACAPDCSYGIGFNIYRLYVR